MKRPKRISTPAPKRFWPALVFAAIVAVAALVVAILQPEPGPRVVVTRVAVPVSPWERELARQAAANRERQEELSAALNARLRELEAQRKQDERDGLGALGR